MPSHTYTVLFARVELPSTPPDLFNRSIKTRLQVVISPDLQVERYGRTWRFSRPEIRERRFMMAKLGFSRPAKEEQVRFDEELEDYVEEIAEDENVNFCHFAIDVESRLLAFELRPPDIRRRSFTSNFQALTSEGREPLTLQVLEKEISFPRWLERIQSLARFEAKLRRPNPTWRPRTELVRRLIESTNADEVDLTAKVDDPDSSSLHVEGSVIEESVRHQAAGYGEVTAKGIDEDREQEFKNGRVVRQATIEVREQEPSTSIFQKLISLLRELVL